MISVGSFISLGLNISSLKSVKAYEYRVPEVPKSISNNDFICVLIHAIILNFI